MTAAEQRAWSESTPAGQYRQRLGVTVTTDHAAVEAHVEEIRGIYRTRFGRELTAAEVAGVRVGGEMRALVATVGRVYSSSHELAEQLGWGVIVAPKGSGFAMRGPDGAWSADSDPVVVAAAEQAEEDRRQAAEADYESWRNGPVALRTIAGPT